MGAARVVSMFAAIFALCVGIAVGTASAATTVEQTVPVGFDQTWGGFTTDANQTIFSQAFLVPQFDPALGPLTAARLSWDLTATVLGTGDYQATARLELGPTSTTSPFDTNDQPTTMSFANSLPVIAGHIGTGDFATPNLVGSMNGHTGSFPWGATFQITGTITVTYIFNDVDAPTITTPADITAEATGPTGAPVTYTTDFDDDVAIATSECTPTSGATFALGATTVTCTASDTTGNATQETFTITVTDTTPPDITIVAASPIEATGPDGADVDYTIDAADLVGLADITCTPPTGSTFTFGTTAIECTATDAAGNIARASYDVEVRDTAGPVVPTAATARQWATLPIGTSSGPVDYSLPRTTDLAGQTTTTCQPPPGSTFTVGVHVIDCTSTDEAGNSTTFSFDLAVKRSPHRNFRPPVAGSHPHRSEQSSWHPGPHARRGPIGDQSPSAASRGPRRSGLGERAPTTPPLSGPRPNHSKSHLAVTHRCCGAQWIQYHAPSATIRDPAAAPPNSTIAKPRSGSRSW